MTQNQEIRLRIEAMNIMVSRHKNDEVIDGYKPTTHKFLQRGFVLPIVQQEYDEVVENLKSTKTFSDAKLELWEQISFGNYFRVLHPEKICGEEFPTTSRDFPIKVKGTMLDVQQAIQETLNSEKLDSKFLIKDLEIKRFNLEKGHLVFSFKAFKSGSPIERNVIFNLKIDKNGKFIFDEYGKPVIYRAAVNTIDEAIFKPLNSERVEDFMGRKEIQAILKPYYPSKEKPDEFDYLIINAFVTHKEPSHIAITFSTRKQEIVGRFDAKDFKIPVASDGYFQWFKFSQKVRGTKDFVEITDKDVIRKYLDQDEIKEILKPYYPEKNDQSRARRIRINAGKAKALLLLLKLK